MIVTADLIVSLHTFAGVQLYQFTPDDYVSLSWGRKQRDASQCDLTVPTVLNTDRLPDIAPWLHWLSVWDGQRDVLLWTGPIQTATVTRTSLAINAKDHGAYLARLRNPISKRWEATDLAVIAAELWDSLAEQQGLGVHPIVRPDPYGERFDFQVVVDAQMLDQTISDLTNLGLRWTIVCGQPILGPLPLDVVATLGEADFLGDGISLVRDGTAVYNDILVRGPDNLARERSDFYGLNLQTIANVDLFGVSNVNRAAHQYLKQTAAVRTKIDLPSGTALHPDAPVMIDDLNPSARFVVETAGVREIVELTEVSVQRQSGSLQTTVTMESVEERLDLYGDKVELLEQTQKGQPKVTLGGQPT